MTNELNNNMQKVNCLNCDHEQLVNAENTSVDELGRLATCEDCDSSFEVLL